MILTWSWRHHALYVDEHDSLDEAVGSLFWMQEHGDGAPESIEVIGEDGSVDRIEGKQLDDMLNGYEKAQAATAPTPKPIVAHITVKSATGTATLEWYYDMAKAGADYQRLHALLAERVTLVLEVHAALK